MIYLVTGLTLGFLSSGHCLGMCGPIAFSLGMHELNASQNSNKKILLFLKLGIGKAMTYAWIGFLFGWVGHLLTRWSVWMGFSMALPWITGALFVLIGLGLTGIVPQFELVSRSFEKILAQYVLPIFKQKQNTENLFVIGMLWGLLPCPMVLAPALGASVSGSLAGIQGAFKGFFMMFGFGLGTIPALYVSAATGGWLRRLQKWSPLAVGLCFILLGIGTVVYSSMIMSSPTGHCCH